VSKHEFDDQFFFAHDSTMSANKFRTPNLLSFGKMKCSLGLIVIISDILKLFSQYVLQSNVRLTKSEHVNCVKVTTVENRVINM
jgi:hypothetical protein